MRLYTKEAILALAIFFLVGCSSTGQKSDSNPPGSEATSVSQKSQGDKGSNWIKGKKGDENRTDVDGQSILVMDDASEEIGDRSEGTLDNLAEPGLAKDYQTVLDEALGFCQVSQDFCT